VFRKANILADHSGGCAGQTVREEQTGALYVAFRESILPPDMETGNINPD
jgi:hypothetical protein